MAKGKTSIFFCQSCGYESSKWMGQCPGCKEWNTFVEEVVDKKSAGTLAKQKATASEAKVLPLSQIEMTYDKRVSTDMKELDRVLGGGIVQGSMVLVGGDPGIGKSTLLLQVCRNLSEHNIKVLYISGEESLQQIKTPVDSRTCDTLPGAEETSSLNIVWMESITTICGFSRSMTAFMVSRFVSHSSFRLSPKFPMRSARILICCKGNGNLHFHCGTCDERGSGGRTEGVRTHGRHRALF